MSKYQRGKIYKITSGELTYIGSTCEPTLARRLSVHVAQFKGWKDGKGKVTSFQVLELGNYEITLLELCPCGSKDELTARERHWIESIPCVNKYIPGRTQKEYRKEHIEKIKEWDKKYKEDHADMIKKYYEENTELFSERSKKYHEDHKVQISERKKAYYQLNKEKINKAKKEKLI